MKKLITCFAVLCAVIKLYGANPDSLTLVQAPWTCEEIAPGVTVQQVHFNQKELFNSNQFLSLIVVAPSASVKFALAVEPLLTTTGEMAEKRGAVGAVNGSFFKFNFEYNDVDYNSVDYIRVNNQGLAPNTYTATGQRQMHQEAAVAILDGVPYIVKATTEKGWENYIYSQEVITSGPLLAIAGRPESLKENAFNTTRHPRTAVAKKADGTVLLLVVDGRFEQAQGMSLSELQKILLWLGARDIINLDGGGSSTMYVKGRDRDGVVNHPCDNRQFDQEGSRRVANAVLLKMNH